MNNTSRIEIGPVASPGAVSPGQQIVDLRKALVLVRKHKWTIYLVTMLITALTAMALSFLSPIYRSTMTILFADTMSETGFERSAMELKRGRVGEIAETQKDILMSRSLAERVVQNLELTNHWEYNQSLPVPDEFVLNSPLRLALNKMSLNSSYLTVLAKDPTEHIGINSAEELQKRAVTMLMRKSNVSTPKQTDLVKVSVESRDRFLAPKVANGYAKALKEVYIEQSANRDGVAKEFLESKVADPKARLDASEQQLLKERRRVGLSGDGGDNTGQTIALLNNRLVDAKAQLELARIQKNQITSAQRSKAKMSSVVSNSVMFSSETSRAHKFLSANNFRFVGTAYELLPIVDSNPLVQKHKNSVQESLRGLNELDNRYGVKHPRVVDARSNLLTLVRNLDRQIVNVITSVVNQYQVSQRQVSSIEADIGREEAKQYDRNASRVSIKEVELTRDSHKRFYEAALQELRSYQERNLQTVPMSVTDHAVVSDSAAKPNKSTIVFLAFALSAVGMVFLTYLVEGLKESVQGISDIQNKLKLPVFGVLPSVKTNIFRRKTTPLIPGDFDDKYGAFAEAVWTIRTSATVAKQEENNQVMMVTSTLPGEGKSTLATNLAHALSELENVVLVEADMRRPGIAKALGAQTDGLYELLNRRIYVEDAVIENAIGDLDIIPAGQHSQFAGKLLASPVFGELIDLLKARYDRVVIDLAPVQAVSDAVVVGKHADSAIYVVKADSTPLPVVNRGIERLTEKGINVSGIVISQVDFAKISSYGGDYYYQGYHDYYGYGEFESSSIRAHALRDAPVLKPGFKRSLSRNDEEYSARVDRNEYGNFKRAVGKA